MHAPVKNKGPKLGLLKLFQTYARTTTHIRYRSIVRNTETLHSTFLEYTNTSHHYRRTVLRYIYMRVLEGIAI